ncbi:MAG: manganese efflux pump MntP family protein [Methanomicrobiales archaeon]|jgi:putative Mn2+ efflux pump MntP|nr:manganese efflux pump MntP family protein [Methanomicrobiales archaeon]
MEAIFTFFIGLGLALDICAIGLSSGTAIQKDRVVIISRISILVALFHALMLFIGWLFGSFISEYVEAWAKYIAAVLLIFIGANMIQEAISDKDKESILSFHTWSGLIALSIATSIDALAIGVSFGVVHNSILLLVLITTPIILITTAATFWLGGKISDLIGKRAESLGGGVLILIGLLFLL